MIVNMISAALSVQTALPVRPEESVKMAYDDIMVEAYLTLSDLIDQVVCNTPPIETDKSFKTLFPLSSQRPLK